MYKYSLAPMLFLIWTEKKIQNMSNISFCICPNINSRSLEYSYCKHDCKILRCDAFIIENIEHKSSFILASAKFLPWEWLGYSSYSIFFLVPVCKYYRMEWMIIITDLGRLLTIESSISYAYYLLFICHFVSYSHII